MAAVAKKAEPDAEPENPNLVVWNAVSKTDPAHTKRVNQRGGFTAISAHYQVMRATEVFGPIGIGWGYDAADPIFHDVLVFVPVTLWHGTRGNTFGPIYGGAEWKDGKGRLDSDAPKKATTDGLTKALSQLGFNADVFLGRFDDNKYVEDMKREFASSSGPPANDTNGNGGGGKDAPFPQGPAKNKTELKELGRVLWREVNGCGDAGELDALVASHTALIAQLRAALPKWWNGGEQQGGEPFEGLGSVIAKRQTELADDSGNGDWRNNPLNGG